MPPTPPRRITRGSLARYAYQASEQVSLRSPTTSGVPDIEDSVPSSSRKRKRAPNITTPSSRARKTRVKNPPKEAVLGSEPESPALATATTSRTRTARAKAEVRSEFFEAAAPTSSSRARRLRPKAEVNYDEDSESASASGNGAVTTSIRTRRARVKNQPENDVAVEFEVESNVELTASSTTRRVRKPARKAKAENGQVEVEPPSDWLEMYEKVKEMRLDDGPAANAPVDTMGCERLAERDATPRDKRFQTLIALMLSSQTKDTVNAVAMKRLQTELEPHVPGAKVGLNLDNILAVEPARLNELIGLVGFHNNKTKYIKQAAVILRDKFGGDIPNTIEGLVSLPGVGPKMAHLCMSAAWNKTEGIGVDVHVHRITNLWGWNKTKTPEETRLALQSWLPRDKWREINWLLVGFGQMVCQPIGRKCGQCELGHQGLCKAADRKKVNDAKLLRSRRAKPEGDRGDENDGPVVKREAVNETGFEQPSGALSAPIPGVQHDSLELPPIPSAMYAPISPEQYDLPVKKEVVKEEDGKLDPRDAAIDTIEQQDVKLDPTKTDERPSEIRIVKREQASEQVVLRQRTVNEGRSVKQESAGQPDISTLPKREGSSRSAFIKRESTGRDAFVQQETADRASTISKYVKREEVEVKN